MHGTAPPSPGSVDFLTRVWRQIPVVYRRFVPEASLVGLRGDHYSTWCRSPATARIFVPDDSIGPGRSTSRLIPDPATAWDIFQRFRPADRLTVLLNAVEKVDPTLREMQETFHIPFRWRLDDIVATLSSAGAGIGYHAGNEDGFILQVQGARRWRVWSDRLVSLRYRRSLLGDDVLTDHPMSDRPDEPPLLDLILEPGDVLYSPALHPHEGETLEESISLSFAWQGISAYDVLRTIRGAEANALIATEEISDKIFTLIPDIQPPSDARAGIVEHLMSVMSCLNEVPTVPLVDQAVSQMLARVPS